MQYVANMTAAQTTSAAIEVDHVSHVYASAEGGVPALDNVSMKVGAGKFIVIVGPSGCGKTSVLMMLAGLRDHTEGHIEVHGAPIPKPVPERVGHVFLQYSCLPRLW
jgi:NitT/TauT family transport system ATP-binding protein